MDGTGRVSRRRRPGRAAAYGGPVMPDGTYDVFVVDAEAGDEPGTMRLDLTVLAGAHKGEVVSMQAAGFEVDELDALGTPGTLTVRNRTPSLVLEP